MSEWVAKCQQCGILDRGDREHVTRVVEDHDQFHSTQVLRPATDGGADLPDHLTRMTRFGQGDIIRCTTCGDEAETRDALTHKEGCPDDPESPVVTDGGEPLPTCECAWCGKTVPSEDREYCADHKLLEGNDDIVSDGGVVVERLHYATASNAARRGLHVDENCPNLKEAKRTNSAPVTHPPRGQLCSRCGGDWTLDELQAQQDDQPAMPDGGRTVAGAGTPVGDYTPPQRGEAARQLAGVGDQDPLCPHTDGALPCFDCLTEGGGDGAE